jgi:hypothetical protein
MTFNAADPNTPLRMWIALKLLRAWNNGTAGWDGEVVYIVNVWIDLGMRSPIPWPEGNPFFDEWAAKEGFSKVENSIGFRLNAQIAGNGQGSRGAGS